MPVLVVLAVVVPQVVGEAQAPQGPSRILHRLLHVLDPVPGVVTSLAETLDRYLAWPQVLLIPDDSKMCRYRIEERSAIGARHSQLNKRGVRYASR